MSCGGFIRFYGGTLLHDGRRFAALEINREARVGMQGRAKRNDENAVTKPIKKNGPMSPFFSACRRSLGAPDAFGTASVVRAWRNVRP